MIARVALAAVLSAAWLAAPADLLATGSRTAVVALVWSAAVGLPVARGGERPAALAALAAAAAAPCLGLAMALERAAGTAALGLGLRGLIALALCSLGAWAAQRARGNAPFAVAWTAFVAGLPLCAALFAWTVGGAQPALALAAAWSPLGWLAAWAAGAPVAPWGALAASLALVALAGRPPRAPTGAEPTGAEPTGAEPTGAEPTGAAPTGAAPTAGLAPCLLPLAVLAWGAGAAAAPTSPFELGRAALVELALTGPLDACELVTEHGTTHVAADLAAGETRRVSVPIAGAVLAREPRLVLAPEAARRGAARLVGAREPAPHAGPLALRVLPPLEDGTQSGADGAALAALAAATLLTLGLRKRPLGALAVGLASGALLAAFGAAGRVPPRPVTIREGAGDAWLAVEVARDALAVEPALDLWLAVEPRASRLGFEVELGPPERWRAVAPGARLVRRTAWSPPDDGWRTALSGTDLGRDLGTVVRGWRRSSDGLWRPLADRGAEPDGGRAPPGWLAAGLAQGLDALVLELAPDPAAGGERWLRWVGSLEKH